MICCTVSANPEARFAMSLITWCSQPQHCEDSMLVAAHIGDSKVKLYDAFLFHRVCEELSAS